MTKRRLIFAITAMLLLALGLSRFTTLPLSAAISHNRLATNRLATNRLATNRLATNRLATNALSSTRLEATEAANELLSTVEGRDLFSYLIGCALPPGTTIEATIPARPTPPHQTPITRVPADVAASMARLGSRLTGSSTSCRRKRNDG